jgi:hypothetical protein
MFCLEATSFSTAANSCVFQLTRGAIMKLNMMKSKKEDLQLKLMALNFKDTGVILYNIYKKHVNTTQLQI